MNEFLIIPAAGRLVLKKFNNRPAYFIILVNPLVTKPLSNYEFQIGKVFFFRFHCIT